eukprot:3034465-Pleurochrysis_carterae.AAC.1
MLRVVCEVDSGHVVHAESRRLLGREPKFSEQRSLVDCFLGRLRSSDDLGLTRGERDSRLLLRGPRDRSLAVDEDVARGGVARRPVGI